MYYVLSYDDGTSEVDADKLALEQAYVGWGKDRRKFKLSSHNWLARHKTDAQLTEVSYKLTVGLQ